MTETIPPAELPVFDLRKRTRKFALRFIRLYASLPEERVSQVLGRQLLRARTSVGAQYHEGYRSRSKAEYISKLESALQELEESMYWLDLLIEAELIPAPKLGPLRQETNELIAIFTTIVKKVKANRRTTDA